MTSTLRLALTLIAWLPFIAQAQDCRQTESCRTVLSVSGSGGTGLDDRTFTFSLEQLQILGVTRLDVKIPWREGETRFEGVLVRDLFASLGAEGISVSASALNGYRITIPMRDFHDFDVILAYRADGKRLSIRERGPLWIIYPWGDIPALSTDLYFPRSVWQLHSLVVNGP